MSLSNYQLFPKKYFSGSDIYIMLNNVIIDEIVDLEFSLTEQIAPIYGYASYTYDTVAKGSRLVNGRFTINFKESMYLYTMMQVTDEQEDKETIKKGLANKTLFKEGVTSEHIATLMKGGKEKKLQEIMDYNEDRIWGTPEEDGDTPHDKYMKPYFSSHLKNPETVSEGFDIIISYGDKEFHTGDMLEEIPSTVKVINGVHFTSVNQLIRPSGDNILEQYTFIGRDLDNSIGIKK